MANQFLNADNDRLVKEKLGQMFIRYDHAIDADRDVRAKNVLSHIDYIKDAPNKKFQRNNANFQLDVFPKLPEYKNL